MRFDLLTLFPDMCRAYLSSSILGRAQTAGHIQAEAHDLRAHGLGRHRQVDDTPYGGGSGMVIRVDVVAAAVEALRGPDTHVIVTDPSGTPFRQAHARRLAQKDHLLVLCGHYEGIDGRVRDHLVDEAISVGDYVLTGGELPALTLVDAVARLVPGVLGNPDSLAQESFEDGLLEGPCYTRPRAWQGIEVPEVLLSGHHGRIAAWRQAQAEARTASVRPALWRRWQGRLEGEDEPTKD